MQLGLSFQGKRDIVEKEGKVYLRFSNIREARNAHDSAKFGSADWCSEYLATFEFNQVRNLLTQTLDLLADKSQICNPAAQFEPISEGQVQITAFGQGVDFGTAHVETVVHTFLETQGEVFAFQRQPEMNDYIFRATVEFSDADVATSVVQKFNGVTLGVCC